MGLFAILAAGAAAASLQAAAPGLSAQAQAAIASAHAAYDRIEMLPPPKDAGEKLHRLLELDQALRMVAVQTSFNVKAIPEAEREAAFRVINAELHAHDLANEAALKAMIPPEGWFTRSKYGDEGETAAYYVVQHATEDRPWMHEILERMEPLVAKGEVAADHYASLYDRVALGDGRLQRYGTQLFCKDHIFGPDKLEDPAQANARRKALGLIPEEEYEKQLTKEYGPCP